MRYIAWNKWLYIFCVISIYTYFYILSLSTFSRKVRKYFKFTLKTCFEINAK